MSVAFASNEFLNLVVPYAPGVGNVLAVQEIRLGARRFCKDSRMLWQDFGPQSFNALQSSFSPVLPTGTSICSAENMRWLGKRIKPTTRELLNSMSNDWTQENATEPTNYLFENETTLRVHPKPTDAVADALTGRLFLRPSMTSTQVDDRLFEHYGLAIAAAALHGLLVMTKKPWSDAERAMYYERLYSELMGDAKIANSTDFTGAEPRVQMRPMA